MLNGPPLRLYAAPFDANRGQPYAARETNDSTTDVPPGRYLLLLDDPGQVRLLSADGTQNPILVGDDAAAPEVNGVGIGCGQIWGHNIGC